jgi:hypothetical protein
MKSYNTYEKDTRRLCSEALQGSDDPACTGKKLSRMQEKIRQSQLTVYQKEFLLNQLCSIREMEHA